MLTFKTAFLLSSFTLIKRLFLSSSHSAIRVVSSAYLRLLIFLLAIWILACDSSNPAFHLMLNRQSDSIQPCHTPFPILNQFIVPCLVLIFYFLTYIQVSQETDKMLWYSHLFKNFPICCYPHSQRH